MAATESEMLELGTKAPEFSLPDPDGAMHGLGDNKPAYLVIINQRIIEIGGTIGDIESLPFLEAIRQVGHEASLALRQRDGKFQV